MLHTFAVLVTSTWYHGTWHGQITWHRQLKDATRWTLPHHCFVQMNVRNNHSSCETKGAFSKPYPCSDVNSDIPSLSRDSNIQLKKKKTRKFILCPLQIEWRSRHFWWPDSLCGKVLNDPAHQASALTGSCWRCVPFCLQIMSHLTFHTNKK